MEPATAKPTLSSDDDNSEGNDAVALSSEAKESAHSRPGPESLAEEMEEEAPIATAIASSSSLPQDDDNCNNTAEGEYQHQRSENSYKCCQALSFIRLYCNLPPLILDPQDPSTWRRPLQTSFRLALLSQGNRFQPALQLRTYPWKGKHRFNPSNFDKITKTNEIIRREWLMYSRSTNSLFCFPCLLFPSSTQLSNPSPFTNYGLGCVGFDNFGHQKRAIETHEESNPHFTSTLQFREYQKRSSAGQLLNQKHQDEMEKRVSFGRQVLRGILDAVLFLAKNNLAFRGSSDKIGDKQCGNFLSLIELLGKYYPPLSVHLASIEKHSVSYLSHHTQNEFLALISCSIQRRILANVRKRKFYSIMLDSTPDSSNKEQISQVIRSVCVTERGCFIEENFIGFINDDGKTGEEITQTFLTSLQKLELRIEDCRGQGYDNGSNMAGIYKGVQARVKELNPLAYFVPCSAHSLNLVGTNALSKSLAAKLLLGQVQNLYNFFSKSTIRWATLLKHAKITMKSQSNTRWSAKARAVSAVAEQFQGIYEALCDLVSSDSTNAETLAEAEVQLNQIYNFRFLLGITIWEKILRRIDCVNITLQKSDISLCDAGKHLAGLLEWLEDFQLKGFEECLNECMNKAAEFGIDMHSGFDKRSTRGRLPVRFRDGQTAHSTSDTGSSNDGQEQIKKFKADFFTELMKSLIKEFRKRFAAVKSCDEDFSFLWGKQLNALTEESLVAHAKDLAAKYEADLACSEFTTEIRNLKSAVKPFLDDKPLSETKPLDILNVLSMNGLQETFFNVHTALRIFLTIPVTVASNERSFSKMKIIKSYLRSSMGQERLNNLAIISIEHSIVESISFEKIIDEFAYQKARKMVI